MPLQAGLCDKTANLPGRSVRGTNYHARLRQHRVARELSMFSNCTLLQKTTGPARPIKANLDRCTGYEDEHQRDDRSNLYESREGSERCTRT